MIPARGPQTKVLELVTWGPSVTVTRTLSGYMLQIQLLSYRRLLSLKLSMPPLTLGDPGIHVYEGAWSCV